MLKEIIRANVFVSFLFLLLLFLMDLKNEMVQTTTYGFLLSVLFDDDN